MHSVALSLGLVLAAEKSKTPFYIAGGVLVAWALFISLGVGMRRPSFPENVGQQRAVMAVSAVLVLIAISLAVVTAGGGKSTAAAQSTSAAAAPTSAPAQSPSPATTTASTPTATTGTPAPASSPAAGAAATLALEADPGGQLAFNTTKLTARAGKVTIEMANMSPVEHNVTIAQGARVLGATPTFTGGKRSLTLTLAPGTYVFYCSVPGHRQAGMEGVLKVGP